MSIEDPLLTAMQIARRVGVSRDKVYEWCRSSLPHYRVNGIRIRLSEFNAWLEGCKVQV